MTFSGNFMPRRFGAGRPKDQTIDRGLRLIKENIRDAREERQAFERSLEKK